jgi:hypothetical protein
MMHKYFTQSLANWGAKQPVLRSLLSSIQMLQFALLGATLLSRFSS